MFWRFLLFVLKYIYRQSDEDLHARVVKLVYTYALGAYAFRRAGSSPVSRTKESLRIFGGFLFSKNINLENSHIKRGRQEKIK